MSERVTKQSVAGISVVTLDGSGSDGLSAPLRERFEATLDEIWHEGTAEAIVIAARGKSFPGTPPDDGDDPAEENRPPDAADLFMRLEDSSIPVFAAMHGQVIGLGLELGLAAHYRIADRHTRFAMPGLALGLLPAAGGLQRLCRAIGPEAAVAFVLDGRELKAAEAAEMGLVDAVADQPLPKFTLDFVRKTLGGNRAPRPLGANDARLSPRNALLQKLGALRKSAPEGHELMRAKVYDCAEASLLLPYKAALAAERAAGEDMRATDASRALRHLHRAEKLAQTPPVAEVSEPAPVSRVAVIGGGKIGHGVAAACLSAGLPVTLVERDIDRLEASVERIIDYFERQVARGRISRDTQQQRVALLSGTVELSAVATADFVVESVDEDPDTKRRVFSALDTVMKREAVLATTTGGLDIDGLAAGTSRGANILGLGLFVPVPISRGAEVIVALETSDSALSTTWALLRRLGKVPIPATVAEGYVIRAVLGALYEAAALTVLDGASVAEVDASLRAEGFALGPFESWDLDGLPASWIPLRDVSGLRASLLGENRTGRAGRQGWYAYSAGKTRGVQDKRVDLLVAERREALGIAPKSLTPEDIRRRLLAAMVNAGAHLLADGVALRPADIDLGMVHAAGYPRHLGGPMMTADLTGALRIKRDLDRLVEDSAGGAFWAPTPLLSAVVKNGLSFGDLNRDPDRIQDL